jgi:hypothetical protein
LYNPIKFLKLVWVDFEQTFSQMGLEPELASPVVLRRLAQTEMRRHGGYLPYV